MKVTGDELEGIHTITWTRPEDGKTKTFVKKVTRIPDPPRTDIFKSELLRVSDWV